MADISEMDELDRKIEEALSAEDRAILESFGEQGVFGQWFGVYDGTMRRIAILATFFTFAAFVAAVFCGWRFFAATEADDAGALGRGDGHAAGDDRVPQALVPAAHRSEPGAARGEAPGAADRPRRRARQGA
ncbi:MAG: DUF6768 family protein [Thermoanaerobaculia bacterium]